MGLSAGSSQRQQLNHIITDYLGSRFKVRTLIDYWLYRLSTGFARYTLECLAFPTARLLFEWVFNPAGGFVTERYTYLSSDTIDLLTFIKMD